MKISKRLALLATLVTLALPSTALAVVSTSINGGGTYDTKTATVQVSPGYAGDNATVYVVDSACTPVNGGGYGPTNCSDQHAVSQPGLVVSGTGGATAVGVPTCGATIQWDVYGGSEQRSLSVTGNHDFKQGAIIVLPACQVVDPRAKLQICGDPGARAFFDNSRSTVGQYFQMHYRHNGTWRNLTKYEGAGDTTITGNYRVDRGSRVTVRIRNGKTLTTGIAPLRDVTCPV